MRFRDRTHAGELLARRLERMRSEGPIVLGVARGGLPVAYEVARALCAPLDAVVVRRLAAPGDDSVAAATLAEGGVLGLNPKLMTHLGLTEAEVAEMAERETPELARRVLRYHGAAGPPDLRRRVVLVVDDGATTGASARAACLAAESRGAARVIFAAPVLPCSVERELRELVDEVVVLEIVPDHFAIRYCYEQLDRLRDEDAIACVERARASRPERITPAPAPPPP